MAAQTLQDVRPQVATVAQRTLERLCALSGYDVTDGIDQCRAIAWARQQGGDLAAAADALVDDSWYYQPRTGAPLTVKPRLMAAMLRRLEAVA